MMYKDQSRYHNILQTSDHSRDEVRVWITILVVLPNLRMHYFLTPSAVPLQLQT